MELESDVVITGGITIKEEENENGDGVTVFIQGELDTLDATRGDATHLDDMGDPLSLTNIDGIKQEHEVPDNVTIKQEHPWTEQNSRATMSAGYSSTEEDDISADLMMDETLDAEADKSSVKIERIENEVDPEPSSAGGADILHCQHCAYTCLGQDVLDKHLRWRHRNVGRIGKHRCDKCTYSTDNSSNMRQHEVTHTGERPFACDRCDKAFLHRHNLTRHTRAVHDGLRPHSCNVCGKEFAHASHLTTHQRIHSGTSVVQCEQCGKQFNNRSNFSRHMKSHDGVKAHKCQVCSARVGTRRNLTAHMRTHTGERPFACRHCSATFSNCGNMQKHVISAHTHDYKHCCERCGKGFITPKRLRKHRDKCRV